MTHSNIQQELQWKTSNNTSSKLLQMHPPQKQDTKEQIFKKQKEESEIGLHHFTTCKLLVKLNTIALPQRIYLGNSNWTHNSSHLFCGNRRKP